MNIIQKSGSYHLRYKSVESGKSDKVIVDYGSYPYRDSVIFKDKYGVKLKVVDGNILSFTGVCACALMSWDWGYDKLPDIFGNSWSWTSTFAVYAGLSLALEQDANKKPVGISIGVCGGEGATISHTSNYVKGIIFHKTEILDLFRALFAYNFITSDKSAVRFQMENGKPVYYFNGLKIELSDKYYEGFREENGFVVYYSNGFKIVTKIAAEPNYSDDCVLTLEAQNAQQYPKPSKTSHSGKF